MRLNDIICLIAVISLISCSPTPQAEHISASVPTYQAKLSVAQAYQRIPHRRTVFNPHTGDLPQADAAFLADLFRIVDQGVSERVARQAGIDASDTSNHQAIIGRLQTLKPPKHLRTVHAEILKAVREQDAYFTKVAQPGGPAFSLKAPLVQSSHKRLLGAYNRLMRQYGQANAHNKQAFFDHLCALDFI